MVQENQPQLKHWWLDATSALLISHDRYYRYMPCGNYDLPEALETDLMIAHLERLRSGVRRQLPESVDRLIY